MAPPLPAELKQRIEALERQNGEREGAMRDFDRRGWLWLALLGLALPIGLLVLGWWL